MTATILYIEDDPFSQTLVERTLRHAGYQVVAAARALEGIDLARRLHPNLILIDLNLPDMSGREVCITLRDEEQFQFTPIVAVTGDGEEQRDMSLAFGANGFLTKPLDVEELPQLIDYYLHGGQDQIDANQLAAARARYAREVVGRLEKRIRDLEASNTELYELDRMKDYFIQLTAHELRTPLTLVYGYNRLLADHPVVRQLMLSDDSVQGSVAGLSEAIERMHDVINELLTMSRIMTNQIDLSTGPTNLGKLVRAILASYDLALRQRKITVEFDAAQWPATMRADSNLLQLAISNLIGNAIKYTPDGGHIYLNAKYDSQMVRFSVRDTGIGIDKPEQSQIFQRFHTTGDISMHSSSKTAFGGGGLGLGLPICKGIVEAHGGRIWVESPGHDPERLPGSEFIVEIPIHTPGGSKVIKRLS